MLLGRAQVFLWIERPQRGIARNALLEAAGQGDEHLVSADCVVKGWQVLLGRHLRHCLLAARLAGPADRSRDRSGRMLEARNYHDDEESINGSRTHRQGPLGGLTEGG